MRRIGSTPQQRGSVTGETCPDVFELDDGDFLIIGKLAPPETTVRKALPKYGANVGTDEEAVIVPRRCIIDAAREILRGEDIN